MLNPEICCVQSLVRNYMPAHKQVLDGRWDISEIAAKCVLKP